MYQYSKDDSKRKMSEKKIPPKQQFDCLAKVAVIGDSSVGKTNILLRYVSSQYQQSHVTTIGIDFKVKTVIIDGFRIKLQIWDTAGQQRFRNLTGTIYQGAEAIILTYAVDARNTFESLSRWIEDVRNHARTGTILALVGNKIDLEGERVVKKEEGEKLAKEFGAIFFETSAKANINIDQVFNAIALQIKNKTLKSAKQDIPNKQITFGSEKQMPGQKGADKSNKTPSTLKISAGSMKQSRKADCKC